MALDSVEMAHQICKPEELKARAAKGDPALLEDLFACYRDDLLRFLRKRCGNPPDADDAVQDAFVAAARYLDGFRGETPIKNWLYRLAASACTRMRRGRKNDPKRHAEYDDALSPTERIGREVEAMLEARLSPLKGALAALPEVDRAVLMLRDGQQLSTREVASTLRLSEAAVKSRLHRARETMRARLRAS
ncbi:MAG: RNA polymerase sigma factor [Deltaproteobacteria bacterium]|nr:RNA polymerase sigma factor [Deltaproteobacteria bacterium]